MTVNKLAKHPGGRPTKFLPTFIPMVEKYLNNVGSNELPSVEGLALYLGVVVSTVYQWAKEHPEFSKGLKRIADKQKQQLMSDGMYKGKRVNASMAIFLLKALHGLKEADPSTLVQVNVTPILGKEEKLYVPEDNSDK